MISFLTFGDIVKLFLIYWVFDKIIYNWVNNISAAIFDKIVYPKMMEKFGIDSKEVRNRKNKNRRAIGFQSTERPECKEET